MVHASPPFSMPQKRILNFSLSQSLIGDNLVIKKQREIGVPILNAHVTLASVRP